MIKHVNILVMVLLCARILEGQQEKENRIVNVGVVLDLGRTLGKIGMSCINMSISDFYAAHPHYSKRLLLHIRDSQNDVLVAASAALDLMRNEEVESILGPISSMQANFVVNLGEEAHVPIITFAATSPSLTSLMSSYFFRIAQNDSAQVNAISDIVLSFGWKQAVPIYVDNEFGRGIIPFLTNALQQANIRVPYLSVISPSFSDLQIANELYKLMTMQTRVFIVHMSENPGSRLFTIAKHIGMMSQDYVWIITNGMANLLTSLDGSVVDAMQGVLGVKTYVPKTKRVRDFEVRWKREFLDAYPTMVDVNLNVFGLWAYDAVTALAKAVERVKSSNVGFEKVNNNMSINFSDLDTLGVSPIGEDLRDALSDTTFTGLAGEFGLANGQLQATIFQIVNVNGNGERGIGFWTPEKRLTRNLMSLKNGSTENNTNMNLGPIIWPGDSYSTPKGWKIPINGKKLRIGIPVAFSEFVNVAHDPDTNTTKVTGYCIEVFDAVVQALPYALPYEFIPFKKPDGEMAGTYTDLINQVYHGKFDAVVGDTTITANRSNYVDFTLPYTESGVSMVVPVKDNRDKSAWVFLKPLTWDLWMMTACSFVFIGFVVWVLEHHINKDFRGPPSHQIGTSFWFSFSTMVFAHREKVVSNLARFVVIIWLFVVLILTQSYTASLTSLLTVEQLRPTVTNVYDLKNNRLSVGFQTGSFVRGILESLGFQDFQLKKYNSTEQLDELFSKGSENGGIAAAFDEIPYIRILLATYCSKYTMVDPTFKTDGFGFVFPRNSPLVADVSRAILKVTEDPRMKEIENGWFHKQSSCPDTSTSLSSNSLGLDNFWGLFLISGVASVSALVIFATTFLYEHRHAWLLYNPNTSVWRRIGVLLRIFDQKDLSSHTFKKDESVVQDRTQTSISHCASEASPSTHYTPPSSDFSTQTESKFSFSEDQGTVSQDNVEVNRCNQGPPQQQQQPPLTSLD
ncbi:hypothetical protein RJT34_10404 [Clitoria ternatea]|uniref:Glutamate receptor n=1 Tax=Clitoria ternatea TaxID=43366 RepID=A0AAN9PX21_CLITE